VFCDDIHLVKDDCKGSNYAYSAGSIFEKNLNLTLFSALPTTVSGFGFLVRFSKFSIGEGIDRVYALYLCRGDINAQTCQACVQAAANTLVQGCQFLKEGTAWYEGCTLCYANLSIFSLEEVTPMALDYNRTSMCSTFDLAPYQQNISIAMDGLIKKVSSNLSLQGFDSTQINLPPSQTWWGRGLAQCTPDILGSPCDNCLRTALKQQNTWANTKIFLPSCLIRFDLYGFVPPPPPPSDSPGYIIRNANY